MTTPLETNAVGEEHLPLVPAYLLQQKEGSNAVDISMDNPELVAELEGMTTEEIQRMRSALQTILAAGSRREKMAA